MPSTTPRSARTSSPPASTAGSSIGHTYVGSQPARIVTRLALDGKAKHNQDGAPMKMYLKMNIPVDMAISGSTIPLFPEENIKILKSQVHPLDSSSAPYAFSSTASPLLHNAARALNLPARSPQTYLSLFPFTPPLPSGSQSYGNTPSVSRASSTSNGSSVSQLEDRYTGSILVSEYQVAYVLPHEFPPRTSESGRSPDGEYDEPRYRSRRGSIGARDTYQFMAAIELWVPLLTRPPRAPYLLSIPTPRCLSNHLRLRISPPPSSSSSSSFASLSSADEREPTAWDLACDPPVTRALSRHHRGQSAYSQLADDESSDSPSTPSGLAPDTGGGLTGTFPSADRVRVRWAPPLRSQASAFGSRRRAGVKDIRGELATAVLGPGPQGGVLLRLEYSAAARGVYHSGVATQLALEVRLDAHGADVQWAPDYTPGWVVTGGNGYTGFDAGVMAPTPQTPARKAPPSRQASGLPRPSSSLLRSPLPLADQQSLDYSFEDNNTDNTPSGTVSSLGSLAAPSAGPPAPDTLLVLHVDMNALVPPARNAVTFTLTGTVLLFPPSGLPVPSTTSPFNPADVVLPAVYLPEFTIAGADSASSTTMLANETPSAQGCVLEVQADGTPGMTVNRGAQARVPEGSRLVLRALQQQPSTVAPPGSVRRIRPTSARRARVVRSVRARVVPLDGSRRAYAVCAELAGDANTEGDWVEFLLADAAQIVSAQVGGVPMPWIVNSEGRRVRIQDAGTGPLAVDYIVIEDGKDKDLTWEIFLPMIEGAAARWEVEVACPQGYTVATQRTNLDFSHHAPTATTLYHYPPANGGGFTPQLFIALSPIQGRKQHLLLRIVRNLSLLLPLAIAILALVLAVQLHSATATKDACVDAMASLHVPVQPAPTPSTVTRTATLYYTETAVPPHSNPVPLPASSSAPAPSPEQIAEPPHSQSSVARVVVLEATPEPSPPPTAGASQALAPIQWPVPKFDWRAFVPRMHPMEKVQQRASVGFSWLWSAIRTVYHYPLDPP